MNVTANDHDTVDAIPRDLPIGAFGGCVPTMDGDS